MAGKNEWIRLMCWINYLLPDLQMVKIDEKLIISHSACHFGNKINSWFALYWVNNGFAYSMVLWHI